MEEIVKRVIWIDKNVKSIENQMFLEILEGGIKNAKFYPVESIEQAFDLIKNKQEEVTLLNGNKQMSKIFQYRLFYVIVSGSLSNDFFNEYVKTTKEYTILSANIIFCSDEAKHRFNAYYLDDFLNPGRVYNEKSFDKIIDYINRDESTFLNDSILMESRKIYKPCKRSYGNVFFNASNISDIAYPFFFGQLINSTLINEYELEGFQKFLLDYYPQLKDLIIPSREKKISIPYYLLAKFYLNMYTYEDAGFFKNMNFDLTNDKFDIYRIYIFLLYDALNKKSIKSYSKNLYRGGVLSLKEFENLEAVLKQNEIAKKNIKKGEISTCLYNCKMFLSFSKSENVAKRFIGSGNKDLIPVLFEVEGLDEKDMGNNDFFISNLDLENISEYNEEEVLFLPFSCFEIVSIKDEEIMVFEKIKVKRITLNYLYKYKTSLYKYIEGIKDETKFENFLNQAINSSFSKEIAQLLNFKGYNFGNELKNLLNQKFALKKNFLNVNPIQCFQFNSANYALTAVNNIFEKIPESVQKICDAEDGNKEKLLLNFSDGTKKVMHPERNKVICEPFKNNKCYRFLGEEKKINNMCEGNMEHKMCKANCEFNQGKNNNCIDKCMEKIDKKDKKLGIQSSSYFEFYSVGIILGDFIANYDKIKDQPLMDKLQSFGELGIRVLGPFVPNIFSKFLPEAIFTKIPYVMALVSATEFVFSVSKILRDKTITRSETYSLITKKVLSIGFQIGLTYLIGKAGFKLLMFMPSIPGKVIAVGAIGLGIAVGFGIKKFKERFIDEKEEPKDLTFFSDSLYLRYIPKKFREYCIPTLSWKGVSDKAKSFAIELVEDGFRKWLIINIKKWIRKIHNDNYFDVGETICEYKGISKNPYKVTFILYELTEETKKEDWGEGKNIQEDYSEKLSKYFNQVATLDVF